ncbi:MAG: hypothetical protein Q9202_001070 [Teloschistes flavicans]
MKRRPSDQRPSPEPTPQEIALRRIMGSDYAPTDPSLERRKYEINMLLLFREVQIKHFQKQLPMNVDVHNLDSYKRLVAFVNNIPARDARYQASRQLFTKEKGFFSEAKKQYLTELAVESPTMTASRLLPSALRAYSRPATRPVPLVRTFKTSSRLLDATSAAMPIRKPVGAFRGGMFGFLLGTTLAGASAFYYIIDEYRVSNELLTEDIYVRDLYERLCV